MLTHLNRSVLFLTALMFVTAVSAQPENDSEEWSFRVGGGAIWAPAFSGSSDYQLMIVPSIRLNYGATFFASLEQGIGYNFEINSEWTAGPLIKFDFGRDADGNSPFRVSGSKSKALVGFKDIDSTIQVGVFAQFDRDSWSTKIELLQGMNGHEGLIADISIDYKIQLGGSEAQPGPPLFITTGPRLRWADADYTNTYYGITAADSLGSGLPTYTAAGGVTSFGWGFSVVMPLSQQMAIVGFAGIDKLVGDAADSPLIIQRGSENQFSGGVFLSYKM